MANETTLKIKLNAAGDDVEFELLEKEAENGDRLDQRVARLLIELNKNIRDPRFMQAYQQNMNGNPQQGRWNQSMRPMSGPMGGYPPFPPGGWGNSGGMNF